MNNWQFKKLGEILQFEYGKPLPKEKRNSDGKYPVYGANGVKDRSNEYFFDKPSIIVGRKGSAGELTLTEDKFWPLDVTYYVIFNESEYNLRFLYLLLLQQDLKKLARGVKPGINRNDVYRIEVNVPPLSEQKRIVKILDQIFENIDKVKENTKKNLQNSKELFNNYLQNVYTNNNWEGKTLKEISLVFGRGKSKHRPRNDKKLFGGKYPFIQTGDIRNSNHHIINYSQTYNDLGLAQSKLWPKGTVCITIAANIAETGVLDFDSCFPDSVIGIVTNPKVAYVDFVEYLLESFKTQIQAKGKGSAQANINMATFENQLFPIPKLTEQKEIVKKLDELSEETKKLEENYEGKLLLLEELRKSFLQKAFSGEL